MAALIIFCVLAAPIVLWGLIDPRSQWRVLISWQYRYPEAHRPSEAAFMMTRVVSGFALAFLIVLPIVLSVALSGQDDRERRYTPSENTICSSVDC